MSIRGVFGTSATQQKTMHQYVPSRIKMTSGMIDCSLFCILPSVRPVRSLSFFRLHLECHGALKTRERTTTTTTGDGDGDGEGDGDGDGVGDGGRGRGREAVGKYLTLSLPSPAP